LTFVPPFDDPHVIAGQGTIGLEIAEVCPRADALVVPLSGGGLFSGVGLAASQCLPHARRIGVANAHGNGMTASLEAGKPVPIPEHDSIADCMAGTISPTNQYSFQMCQQLVENAPLVPEASIIPAMRHAFFEEKLVLEGGAAIPIAYVMDNSEALKGQTVVLVITGQNIDMGDFLKVVS
jgi:threonine dehydratase